ncbi:response regulator receiver domain [Winogradskyella wichelsiae]|uniref:response regulator receiver domain n=1 Tax=Winogradskyella wichelsiae TaxID=2697007 RepID=UPI003EF0C147
MKEETINISEDADIVKFDFADIAKQIIKTSIRSAVCIDDRFIEPYMDSDLIDIINEDIKHTGESLSDVIPSGLYKSFRKDGECDLDIYHFKNIEESWHPEYMLNNKDLVVLDWELDGKGNSESSLTILKEIIDSDKIPFVIIYTQKPKAEFHEIASMLIEKFNKNSRDKQKEIKQKFIKEFDNQMLKLSEDEEWDEDKVELFWEQQSIVKTAIELITVPSKGKQTIKLIIENILSEFNISNANKIKSVEKKIATVLKSTFSVNEKEPYLNLVYLLIDAKNSSCYDLKRISVDEIGFRINNCIVTLFSKPGEDSGVSPDNVFTQFSNLISSSPHNFITLLSLEMRDRFREDFSRIGNDISQIDERAFFYHLEYYKKRSDKTYINQFYDFLLKSWTNELTEYNINLKPSIFNVIEDYQTKNRLVDIKGNEIINPLADLAVKLSTTTLEKRAERDSNIRFGDIFEFEMLVNNSTGEDEQKPIIEKGYFLSLTPHCVCIDSCKIDNNFYFIRSENFSTNYTRALKKVEVEHYSFVKNNDEVVAINWGDCKPFTLFIKDNDIADLVTYLNSNSTTLKYVTTLQENFAQRIANKSFSYGTSIGIDLPHLS